MKQCGRRFRQSKFPNLGKQQEIKVYIAIQTKNWYLSCFLGLGD